MPAASSAPASPSASASASREALRLQLSAVRDEIRDKLLAEKEEQAYQQWLQDLRGRATIEVDWSRL
jgi:peptidyl-prolyl cis-trans isomerase C